MHVRTFSRWTIRLKKLFVAIDLKFYHFQEITWVVICIGMVR